MLLRTDRRNASSSKKAVVIGVSTNVGQKVLDRSSYSQTSAAIAFVSPSGVCFSSRRFGLEHARAVCLRGQPRSIG